MFAVAIMFLLTVDITIKMKIDSAAKSQEKIEMNTPDRSATVDSDSISMDKSIGNK